MTVVGDMERSLSALSSDERQGLAVELVMIVSPYGSVDATVIDPDEFVSIATGLRDAYSTGDRSQLAEVQASCRRIIDRYPDDEPDGAGFFAFGAVVSIYYATETFIEDSPAGVVNAAKRFLDVLGTADDDGCAGLFAAAQGYLSEPSEARASSLRQVVQGDAARLRALPD